MTSAGMRERFPPATLVAACLAAVGLFLGTLWFGFTYDDVPIIVQNPIVHHVGDWRAVIAARWWNDALYRPLTLLSFAVDWALSGGQPFWFHLVNILLHVANTVGVFVLTRRDLGSRGAGVAALLFAVHPVHVEAVANVVGRAELIATLGVLLAVISYREEARSPSQCWALRVVILLGALAAFAGKESAFALPALLLIVDWLDAAAEGEPFQRRLRRRVPLWGAVVIAWGLWLTVWFARAGNLPPTVAPGLEGLSALERASAMLPVVPQYARLLLVPAHLSADYSPRYLVAGALDGSHAFAAFAVLTGVIALAAAGWRWRRPAVTAGVLWAGAAILVVCNVAFPSEILIAERTLYLPSVGVVMAAAALAEWMLERSRIAGAMVVGVVVALACARTVTRVPVWRDNPALLGSIVRDAPGSYRADWIGGMFAYEAHDRAGGRVLLERAVAINPRDAGLLSDLANRLEEDSAWMEAGRRLESAYDAKPVATLYAARAIDDDVRAGELARAANVVSAAWPRDSASIPLRIARSDLADAAGNPSLATDLRLGVARSVPGAWQYWIMTAEVAARAGRCDVLDEALARVRDIPAAAVRAAPLVAVRKTVRCAS